MGSRGIALPFHDHGTWRGWGVSVTPRPLFTPGKDPVPIVQGAGWVPGPVWKGAVNLAPPAGFDPRTLQPVASRYSDYAIRPTLVQELLWFIFRARLRLLVKTGRHANHLNSRLRRTYISAYIISCHAESFMIFDKQCLLSRYRLKYTNFRLNLEPTSKLRTPKRWHEKFCTAEPQISGAALQNSVAKAAWHQSNVHRRLRRFSGWLLSKDSRVQFRVNSHVIRGGWSSNGERFTSCLFGFPLLTTIPLLLHTYMCLPLTQAVTWNILWLVWHLRSGKETAPAPPQKKCYLKCNIKNICHTQLYIYLIILDYNSSYMFRSNRKLKALSIVHSTCSKISLMMALQLGRNM